MKTNLSAALAVALAVVVGGVVAPADGRDAVPGDSVVECISYRHLEAGDDFPNMWEYIYDVVGTEDALGDNYAWTKSVHLRGFDGTLVVNTWEDDGMPGGTKLKQNWAAEAAGFIHSNAAFFSMWYPVFLPDRFPSYWNWGTSQWDLPDPAEPNYAWAMDNVWHPVEEFNQDLYYQGDSKWRKGWVHEDGVTWENDNPFMSFGGLDGLLQTFRIVHPYGPGDIEWETYHNYTVGDPMAVTGTITGPAVPPQVPGDFSGPEGVPDGTVDAYDIDHLCDNMGGAPALYDLDNSGAVDEGDLVYLVQTILGTYMGDFNLDLVVNATDLGTMSTNFGLSGFGWAGGNANCDDVINATDLGLLSSNFGLGGGGSSVPEPATLALLALGGLAMLRRRKS